MSTFRCKNEATKFADEKNSAPLPEGKEKRVPFKVYSLRNGEVELFGVAQSPAAALNAGAADLGITVELVGGADNILPPSEYIKRLSPEKLAELQRFLGQ